jgi:iron complex outermembrane receptor protein
MSLNTPRRGLGISAVAAFVAFAVGQPSFAQSGNSGADAAALDEVVVTARKSEERLVDVPLAITAFSAAAIEQRGIRDLEDIASATPGLTFSDVQAGFLPTPVIRGFAPIDVRGENNAAIFVDGVFVSGREGLNFSQLDLERIEVIKGPQAALYGRNSFSGALNYVTAKPTDEFRGKAEAQFGSSNKVLAALSVSGPLIEGVLKGRAAVSYDNFDGSYNNRFAGIGGGSNIGGYTYETFQGSLVWTPSENFEGELSVYASNDNVGNSAISPVQANCENLNSLLSVQTPTPAAGFMNYCGTFQAVGRNGLSAIPQATGNDRDLARAHLNLKWQTGIGTITSLTGYSKLDQSFYVDGSRNIGENVPYTYIARPATGLVPVAGGAFQAGLQRSFRTGLLQIGGGTTTEEVSTELRLSSDPENSFRWSTGFYYYDTKSSGGNDGVVSTKPLPADFYAFCLSCRSAALFGGPPNLIVDPAFQPPDTTGFLSWFTNPTGDANFNEINVDKISAPALFASAEFDFAEAWTARLEGRYTDEKKSFKRLLTNASGSKSWGITNYRATLDYKPADNLTIYASYAHAEKSGAIGAATVQFTTDPVGRNSAALTTFDPEENGALELGVKGELLDRRLYFDFALYQSKWKSIVIPQIQTELVDPRTGALTPIRTPTAFNDNAGDATIRGAEGSLQARLGSHVDASLGISYIDAQYDRARVDSFKNFPSFSPFGDVSGKEILRQSPWQIAASLGYKAPVNERLDWYLRGDYSYRDEQFADATNQAITPDQSKLNMQIGLRGESWTLELWGRNLTNEDGPSAAYRDVYFTNSLPDGTFFRGPTGTTPAGTAGRGTFFPWRYSVSYPTLREYGVTVRFRF